MVKHNVAYCAGVYYEYDDGEKIVFKQDTSPKLSKSAWCHGNASIVAKKSYTIVKDGKPLYDWMPFRGTSIFDDVSVNRYVGYYAGRWEYNAFQIPTMFKNIGIIFYDLGCAISGDTVGYAFTRLNHKKVCYEEPKTTAVIPRWEHGESESPGMAFRKMLTEVEKIYQIEFDIREFI